MHESGNDDLPLEDLIHAYDISTLKAGGNFSYGYFSHQDLSNRDLSETYFDLSFLEYVDLSNTNLRGASFQNAVLEGSTLRNTDLAEAIFGSASLHDADLTNANLQEASLTSTNLSEANLHSANLEEATLAVSTAHQTTFSWADMTKAFVYLSDIADSDFTNTDLTASNFVETLAENTDFGSADMTDASMTDVDLSGANFIGTVFSNTTFSGTNIEDAFFLDVDLDKVISENMTGTPNALPDGWLVVDGSFQKIEIELAEPAEEIADIETGVIPEELPTIESIPETESTPTPISEPTTITNTTPTTSSEPTTTTNTTTTIDPTITSELEPYDTIIKSVSGKGKLKGTKAADAYIFDAFETFTKKAADKIIGFDSSEGDTIAISAVAFPGLDGESKIEFASTNSKKKLKQLSKKSLDFVYFEKKGQLYYDGNGSDKKWGDSNEGGLVAILKGKPELTIDDFILLG